jgi:hypothetical protein
MIMFHWRRREGNWEKDNTGLIPSLKKHFLDSTFYYHTFRWRWFEFTAYSPEASEYVLNKLNGKIK